MLNNPSPLILYQLMPPIAALHHCIWHTQSKEAELFALDCFYVKIITAKSQILHVTYRLFRRIYLPVSVPKANWESMSSSFSPTSLEKNHILLHNQAFLFAMMKSKHFQMTKEKTKSPNCLHESTVIWYKVIQIQKIHRPHKQYLESCIFQILSIKCSQAEIENDQQSQGHWF